MHVYSQSKNTTQSYNRVKGNYLQRSHLYRFTYKTGATHTFTQKAKKTKATLIGKEADRSVDQMRMEPG